MQQYPELMGRLTIKIFVAIGKPDEHGRLNGQWRTLFTRYMHREDVAATLEQFAQANPMLNGNFYGSFGMTALEGASYKKIVLTQNITGQELYKNTYGDCELVICNTYNELKKNILNYKDGETHQKANDTYLWWERNHSEYATGSRLADILNRVCR